MNGSSAAASAQPAGGPPGPSPRPGEAPPALAARLLAVAFFAAVLLPTAWLCDDAFITIRTVDNLVHGFGLRWNIAERVQTFTHPLWVFLLTPVHAVVGSGYLTLTIASLTTSVAAAGVFAFAVARSWGALVLGVAALALSRSFVDYSTSGLENPLTHLLIVAFVAVLLRAGTMTPRRAGALACLAALAALNRLDTVLLFGPALAWALARAPERRRALAAMALGALPLALWLLFALVYFGFPLPNTYYAKVGTGVSQSYLWAHGISYVLNLLRHDRVAAFLLLTALVAIPVRRSGREVSMVAGIVLYGIYVVHVGGDFMAGRFFTAPFVAAVALLAGARAPWFAPGHPAFVAGAAALLLLGFTAPRPTLLPEPAGAEARDIATLIDPSGVSDERGFYAPHTALSVQRASRLMPDHSWSRAGEADRRAGTRVAVRGSIGFYGYHAGPRVHVVDPMALTDPLLARLPAAGDRPRIGHYERRIPEGYLAGLEAGENRVEHPRLREFHERLRLIVSGPLFSPERLKALVLMNLGRFDRLIDREAYRRPATSSIAVAAAEGDPGRLRVPEVAGKVPPGGLTISLPARWHAARLAVEVGGRGLLRTSLLRHGEPVAVLSDREVGGASGDAPHVERLPAEAAAAGYDGLRFEPRHAFDAFVVRWIEASGPDAALLEDARQRPVGPRGLWIALDPARAPAAVVVAAEGDLDIAFLSGGLRVGGARVAGRSASGGEHTIELAGIDMAARPDAMLVRPAAGTAFLRRLALVPGGP